MRLIVGKLKDKQKKKDTVVAKMEWREADIRATYVENFACDPDGVTSAQVAFDTRGIDSRGSESFRHFDTRDRVRQVAYRERATRRFLCCHMPLLAARNFWP